MCGVQSVERKGWRRYCIGVTVLREPLTTGVNGVIGANALS
jgi:hypothetical protein